VLALPPLHRPAARLALLDITKFYGAGTGGIRTYLHAKAAWTARHPDIRHAVVVPGASATVQEQDGARWYVLRGPPIPGASPYRGLIAPRAIARILAHERPDVIELGSHFLVPWQVLRACRGTPARIVWYAHADLAGLAAGATAVGAGPGGCLASVARRYVRALARRVDLVLAGSEGLAERLREAGAPRVEVAPLGVDLGRHHPGRRNRRAEVQARYRIPKAPFAVFAGRLAREKELELAIRAWPEVERRTGIRLVLAGAGTDRARLQRLPGAAAVTWIPFEPDPDRVADLLAAAEFYLAPGPHETFGLAAAEAAAGGVPALTVDRGAVSERVRAAGTGIHYRRGDAASLVAGAEALAALGPALGRRARAHAEAHLGWESAFERLFAIYRGLAAR
jgi:alpha-1,6-mannosyltransferase